MSYTLLIDCSDTNLSIGVSKDSNLVYKKSFYAWQRQSEYMIPEIKLAMETIGINVNDISTIALGIGPGSYTGIRIPLTIAKTLAVINKAKVIPLSSLQIMGNHDEKYIALMNARSNRSYIGIYENGQKVIDDKIIDNDELIDFISPYVDKGFTLKGNLKYLNLDIGVASDVVDGLFSYSLITSPTEDAKAIKPVYLKDNYENNKS